MLAQSRRRFREWLGLSRRICSGTREQLARAEITAHALQTACGGKSRHGAVVFLPQAGIRKAAKARRLS